MRSQRDSPERVRVPVPATSFIAREMELETITALLQRPDVRLVTLVGPGGVGKTRLALRVVADEADAFDSRVDVISLAPIREHGLVLRTIARALGIPEQAGLTELEALARGIGDRRRLIVLDNLEQVIAIGPEMGELLSRCPQLTLLATSRIRLNIAGEYLVQIQPLDLPEQIGRVAPEMAETAPAIALFIERARQSQTHFTLTAANCADVIAICQKLDGLPLAIELAAARLAILSPGVLRARLDQRFRLLTGGPQDQPARLRSLSDAIDWSYSLLTEAEQTMLRVLAIFLGGWTISAAAEVAGLDDADAFDLIVSLDEKSLVRA